MNRFVIIVLFVLSVLFIFGCTTVGKKYNFTCPSGWISNGEDGQTGMHISCAKSSDVILLIDQLAYENEDQVKKDVNNNDLGAVFGVSTIKKNDLVETTINGQKFFYVINSASSGKKFLDGILMCNDYLFGIDVSYIAESDLSIAQTAIGNLKCV